MRAVFGVKSCNWGGCEGVLVNYAPEPPFPILLGFCGVYVIRTRYFLVDRMPVIGARKILRNSQNIRVYYMQNHRLRYSNACLKSLYFMNLSLFVQFNKKCKQKKKCRPSHRVRRIPICSLVPVIKFHCFLINLTL